MNPAKWLVIAWFAATIAYVLTRLVRPKRARETEPNLEP